MARQFRSDDSSKWNDRYGDGSDGVRTVNSNDTFTVSNSRTKIGFDYGAPSTSIELENASTFSNGNLILIHKTRGSDAGLWELNKIASGGGTTALTLAYPLQHDYITDTGNNVSQVVRLPEYSSVTVNNGFTWSAPAWDGSKGGIIAFLCKGTVSISGTISARDGFLGASGSTTAGLQGEGTAGVRNTASTSANGNGGGGGSNADFNGGGGGGNGAAGSNSSSATGGSAVGNAGLTLMNFGGGGGSGGNDVNGAGGKGGGLVLIIAKEITLTGTITVNGTDGAGSASPGSGGGGGAGGSVLLKGQVLTLGTTKVTASAGAGLPFNGANGAVGRIHADYSNSLSGTTTPTIDSRQDASLADAVGGAFLLNFI